MPAVNPSRLQRQIEDVLRYFDNPGAFHRRMVDLFSLYANRTLQFGESTESRPTAPMYHLPQPLIRQFHMAIKPYLENNPQTALECADELWKDSYLEVKQFAILILGNVTVQEPDPIIDRVESWVSPNLDDRLKCELMSTGMNKLHDRFPPAWEKLIQSLLDHKDPKVISFGIQGIIEDVKRTKFGNFPLVFRLISPIIQNPHTAYLEKLEALISNMVNQSPTETAFFLKQTVSLSKSTETKRLIKRCLPLLPEKDRNELKSSLS